MIVRMIWPRCGFQNGAWVEKAVDSFWVECTPHEIENISTRWLSPQQQALKEFRSRRPEPDCNTFLLVAQDLSSIQPMEEHYPYGNLWNAYSPFRPIHPREVNTLDELRNLDTVALLVGPQSPSDRPFTRRMRFHQSWYRANELGIVYGTGPTAKSTRPYGNMLPPEAGENGLNFLTPAIFTVAKERSERNDGLVERFRLLHNMLASQAMCFNLFGPLMNDLDVATAFIRALLPDQVERVIRVEVEYAPKPGDEYLDDNTAFDAFIEYTHRDGTLAFLAVETKLTEPFSQKQFDSLRYRDVTEHPTSPWARSAWPSVANIRHNQLWRDHLLVESMLRHPASRYSSGQLALIRHPEDLTCAETVVGYRQLLQRDNTFIDLPLDRLTKAWRSVVSADDMNNDAWLTNLQDRYLRLENSETDWHRHCGIASSSTTLSHI